MVDKPLKRPRDPIQLAKLIGDIATGQVEDRVDDGKDPQAVKRGKAGGKVGGKKRMTALTEEERRALAQRASEARWKKEAPADRSDASVSKSVKQR